MSQINYLDTIRLRTKDGFYIRSRESAAFEFTRTPDQYCNFTLREYNYKTSTGFGYSGNLDADTIDCNMNFRLTQESMPDDKKVVSVDIDNRRQYGFNVLFNGVSWDAADDFETFLAYNPSAPKTEGAINHGSELLIRNMRGSASNNLGKFWRDWGQKLVAAASAPGEGAAARLDQIERSIEATEAERLFLMVAELQGGKMLSALAPQYEVATVFIIEKV